MTTADFGNGATNTTYITGVVYNDVVQDNHAYDIGEGMRGAIVAAYNVNSGDIYYVTTGVSGAYTLALPPGTYKLGCTGTYTNNNGQQSYFAYQTPAGTAGNGTHTYKFNIGLHNPNMNMSQPCTAKVSTITTHPVHVRQVAKVLP